MSERVVLVDERDSEVGTEEKLRAHREGRLHRAFSVFVLDDAGRLLLQRRAWTKYHSRGLWSNTCCSHPRPGESVEAAARRRLREELGFECAVERVGTLLYRAEVGGGLIEHEYDHLLVGRWNGSPDPEPSEVAGWRWIEPGALHTEVDARPDRFTYWFREALPRIDALPRRDAVATADPGSR